MALTVDLNWQELRAHETIVRSHSDRPAASETKFHLPHLNDIIMQLRLDRDCADGFESSAGIDTITS